MPVRILALVGSLRTGSFNRQLAEAAARVSPDGVTIEIVEGLTELPYYDEDIDLDGVAPRQAVAVRRTVGEADALMLFTPEYNGTTSAVLKNAVDWLSRPYGASALSGKPTVVLSATYGQFGGVWAQEEVSKALGVAGAQVIPGEGVAVGGTQQRFADTHPADDPEIAVQLRRAVISAVPPVGRLRGDRLQEA
ncbi:NAD(P)H-dependent oxidoreductase [Streptomyces sp. NPDC005962]|uniref:NADPH-dependent FMN reductase n=1 Tax=Streptomyces sp. NPDC005962 TaxID=3154466 RepID=UPI0033F1BBAF